MGAYRFEIAHIVVIFRSNVINLHELERLEVTVHAGPIVAPFYLCFDSVPFLLIALLPFVPLCSMNYRRP
jgi:hypothetical protein